MEKTPYDMTAEEWAALSYGKKRAWLMTWCRAINPSLVKNQVKIDEIYSILTKKRKQRKGSAT